MEELGLIMRIRKNGIVVLVPRFGIEGHVFMVTKEAQRAGAAQTGSSTAPTGPPLTVPGCVRVQA